MSLQKSSSKQLLKLSWSCPTSGCDSGSSAWQAPSLDPVADEGKEGIQTASLEDLEVGTKVANPCSTSADEADWEEKPEAAVPSGDHVPND